MTNLKTLALPFNQIKRIEGLDNLLNLEELGLGRNKIKKIEGLDNLVNLKRLSINRGHSTRILENLRKKGIDVFVF